MKIIGKYPNIRLRRVRNSKCIRDLISENHLSNNDLIFPIFIRDGNNKIEKLDQCQEFLDIRWISWTQS